MKNKIYFLIGITCLFNSLLNGQVPDFDWAIQLEANASEYVRTNNVAVDQNGNIYVSGEMFATATSATATIDFSSGSGSQILSENDGYDFLAKYDKDWNLLWANLWDDPITVKDMSISNDTNLIITGDFGGSRDFQFGDGEFIVENDFSRDLFIGKLDGNGNVVYVISSDTESGSSVYVNSIQTDNAGNMYLFGHFSGTADFANGDETFELTAENDYADYIAKYNTDGDLIFVKTIVGATSNGFALTEFSVEPNSGDIFFTGVINDPVDLDPDPIDEVIVFNPGNYTVTTKWNSQGEYQWHKTVEGIDDFGGVENMKGFSDGSVAMVGRYTGTVNLDPGGTDTSFTAEPDAINSFILTRSVDGTLLAVHSLSSQVEGSSADPDILFKNMEVDYDNGIYVYGEYKGTVDFDPGDSEEFHTSPSQANFPYTRDKFYAKYDQDLNFLWFTRLSQNSGNTDLLHYDFKVDNEKSLITVATFNGTLVFPDYTFSQGFADSGDDALILKIKQCKYEETVVKNACDSLNFDGQILTESGMYQAELASSLGCDSIVNLELTIFNSQSSESDVFGCSNYEWPLTGDILDQEGTYSTILATAQGCDSTVAINLTLEDETSTLAVDACETYTWESNGETYTESGTHQVTLQNALGCDSTIVLDLVVFNSSSSSQEETACESYQWEANNTLYEESGTYETTLSTINGCDSLITLNLTILESSESSQSAEACDSFLWEANGEEYFESGVYEAVLTNQAGCDSTITVSLEILNDSIEQFESACGEYEWAVNGQTYVESGTFSESFTNINGCDSIITLNLEINDVNIEITVAGIELTAEAEDADFQWVDCDNNFAEIDNEQSDTFIPVENGLYAVIVNQFGCTDTSACISVTTVGVANLSNIDSGISVFPNPSGGEFRLDFNFDREEIQSIRCFDMHGRFIKDFSSVQGNRYNLEGEDGIYALKVRLKNGNEATLRLVLID